MHLPPGMEWNDEAVTMLYLSRDNMSNITNTSNTTNTSFTGATIASPIVMFLCGVIGNLLALFILHRTRLESQRLMFHSLVAGLVWNDLIGIVLTSPVTIASYINGLQMPGGDHLCRFNGFVMICFGLSTPLIVSAMAIERFLFVKYTFFYTKHCAPGAARLFIVLIWAFVLLFGLLPMFGFGNYVLQYPRTWCFLDFRTSNPVHAAYSYMYSCLNLLLVLVMVVCNLVVVATLARVRDYRRKYSTGSLNSVLIADAVVDDSQRQQALARRRKQKDIELQMIVVMCAITTIFAVCWAPLMIHISMTLATKGETDHVLGLVAIRLASLNQTLNPWLYVILRRTLIIRIKNVCCRWKKIIRKKSTASPAPVLRRHQYVHVRNQLCHRSNFVGGHVNNESLSDSMRKSLAQAIPAAMSLPDVMMVNTGRRDLDMPLPDVAKAQSFAGRVSHSYSLASIASCAYCNSPAMAGCAECLKERYRSDKIPKMTNGKKKKNIASEEYPKCPNNSKVSEDQKKEIMIGNGQILYNKQDNELGDKDRVATSSLHGDVGQDPITGTKVSRETNAAKPPHQKSSAKSDSLRNRPVQELFSNTSSTIRNNSLHGRSHDSRLSQHMHKPRTNSKSSGSKSSSSKGQAGSRLSTSMDGPAHNLTTTEKGHGRTESVKSGHQHEAEYNELFLDDSKDSDEVFNDNMVTSLVTRKDTTTTDDNGFSSLPTESLCLSDTGGLLVEGNSPKKEQVWFPLSAPAQNHPSSSHGELVLRGKARTGRMKELLPRLETSSTRDKTQIPLTNNVPPGTSAHSGGKVAKGELSVYRNQAYNRNSSDSSSYLLREDSEDDRSSGIFSAESPARNSKDLSSKPKWRLKKESQSEVAPEVLPAVEKQPARRVKSYN